jgi:hypothetical protein
MEISMKNIITILLLSLVFFGCKKDSGTSPFVPITVNGFVKDYRGNPVSGATVLIPGKATVTTTASGTFSIADVTTPYDISVIFSSYKTAMVYRGLNKPDPKLLYMDYLPATSFSGTISGTVPVVTGKSTIVCFVDGSISYSATMDTTTGAYSITPNWYGTTDSLVGNLFILRYGVDASGLPIEYDAYGTKTLTLKNGATLTAQNFSAPDLVNPSESNISGTIVRPSDYIVSSRSLYLRFNNAYIALGSESSPSSDNFAYTVPSIQEITFAVYARASKTSGSSFMYSVLMKHDIVANSTGVSVPLYAPPSLTIPLNNSTNIDTLTQFTWSQGDGAGVNLMRVFPTSGSYPSYYIFTTGTVEKIPSFSAQALGLPANTAYKWMIYRYYPLTSIDDIASDTFRKLREEWNHTYGYSYSEVFNFTTKP